MQLDVESEPYLSSAQVLCILMSTIFHYKSVANWQSISAVAQSESLIFRLIALIFSEIWIFFPVRFLVQSRQTDSDAYE